MSDETIMPFDFPQDNPTIIKVIGVGGGGGNAVNHMYKEGIHDVTFVVCNTDNQALAESPVPVKLQLGKEGLGAGNRPARAREAAEESIEDVKHMLNDGCKMVFITAGMGGGTGTGAAPIIAKTAKDMDILTVGIVTIPFLFEGNRKIDQALDGVEQMSQHVDALLVINNERLRDIYSDFSVMNAFGKADDTLSVAAKSIAEIITIRGTINLDFNDVKTVLKDGGVAIMSTGYGEGENRVSQAINDALHSPLLNNNDIFNSKKILFNISFSTKSELMMEEMNEVHDFMSKFGKDVETKWGLYIDETLENKVKSLYWQPASASKTYRAWTTCSTNAPSKNKRSWKNKKKKNSARMNAVETTTVATLSKTVTRKNATTSIYSVWKTLIMMTSSAWWKQLPLISAPRPCLKASNPKP